MTIICAINDGRTECVLVGCNDGALLGNIIAPSIDDKWVALGDWLIGMTGSGPKSEAIEAATEKFPRKSSRVIDVCNFMREAFAAFDIGETEDAVRKHAGTCILVHKSGRIYDCDTSFCLTEIPENRLWARGSGFEMAIGAASAYLPFATSARALIHRTLVIVTENDADCPGKPLIRTFDRAAKLGPASPEED